MTRVPLRAVRVPDDLWRIALQVAEREGTTLSEVIRGALRAYVDEHRQPSGRVSTQVAPIR